MAAEKGAGVKRSTEGTAGGDRDGFARDPGAEGLSAQKSGLLTVVSSPVAPAEANCVPLVPAASLSPDSVTRVTLDSGHALAVYRLGDEYFVSDDVCTHGEASLAEGDIEDGMIVCPYHQGSFDIRTGEARAYPCITPLKVYPVELRSGAVCAQLDEALGVVAPES
jgi:p-cumate 2,3-dioxygenase ferredoxin subunit